MPDSATLPRPANPSTARDVGLAQAPVEKLDNRIWVVTPEQIRFQYQTVGMVRRAFAFLLDMLFLVSLVCATLFLLFILFVSVTFLINFTTSFRMSAQFLDVIGGVSLGLLQVFLFVVWWFYSVLQEFYFNGQTWGKMSVGIRTVSIDGRSPTLAQCLWRNFLRLADGVPVFPLVFLLPADGIPVFPLSVLFQGEPASAEMCFALSAYFPTFVAGITAMLITQRYQRIGDLFAGTMVVDHERTVVGTVPVFHDIELLTLATQIPRNFSSTRELSETLSLYVGRRARFYQRRRDEIAGHLARPLIKEWGLPPDTGADLLVGAVYVRSVCELTQVEQMLEQAILVRDREMQMRAGTGGGGAALPGTHYLPAAGSFQSQHWVPSADKDKAGVDGVVANGEIGRENPDDVSAGRPV